jgi:cation transport ATPase
MDYEIDTKKAKLSIKSLALLLASIIILPFCLLIPFADHSSKLQLVLAFSSIDGTKPGCIANSNLVAHNQCATWLEPRTIWPLAVLLLAAIVTFRIGLNFYASKLEHKDGKRYANYRFVIALAISIISFTAFVIMRDASQNHGSYDFGLVGTNLASGGSLMNGGPYTPISHAAFGYGITPAMAILLIVGFLLPAFISWHQFIFSRKHVDGQKKKVLFQ